MSKPELEFHLPQGPFTGESGNGADDGATGGGVREQVLASDAEGTHRTVLVSWRPGTDTSGQGVSRHPFWEEVYLLEGSLHDLTLGETFTAGSYACRPPGMAHGPWTAPEGVTMLVFTYPPDGARPA